MPLLFHLPKQVAVDANGTPYAGAKANFYLTGTTTRTDTYSDSDLTTAHANPVVSDSNGVFAPIYMDPATDYKLVLTESDDTEIYTVDPVQEKIPYPGHDTGGVTGYTVLTTDDGRVLDITSSSTIDLPALSTISEGFTLILNNTTTSRHMVDANSTETIKNTDDDDELQFFLDAYSSCMLTNDGTNWIVHKWGPTGWTYTGAQTGYASNLTPTVKWSKIGNTVTLSIEAGSTGTSNATTMTLNIPNNIDRLWPRANSAVIPCRVTDNGGESWGIASIDNAGLITFGVDATGAGGFTASGTKGLPAGWQITYTVF